MLRSLDFLSLSISLFTTSAFLSCFLFIITRLLYCCLHCFPNIYQCSLPLNIFYKNREPIYKLLHSSNLQHPLSLPEKRHLLPYLATLSLAVRFRGVIKENPLFYTACAYFPLWHNKQFFFQKQVLTTPLWKISKSIDFTGFLAYSAISPLCQ